MRLCAWLVMCGALVWPTSAEAGDRVKRDLESLGYLLPRSVLPERYEVYLVPFHPQLFTFTGNVTITALAAEPADNVTLHANYLQVSRAVVRTVSDPVRELGVVSSQNSSDSRHLYVLWLNESLVRGQHYDIIFEFTGELRDDMYGFYRSTYVVGNETRLLAATQFESTHARRAFPCFDEPSFKATFQINIARSTNMTALSNMPLNSTSPPDGELGGRVWDGFQETVKMSTYLVAVVVADFHSLTSADGKFATWARPDAVQLGAYSQAVGPLALRVLENYTGIAYALPKVDQVALPDFAAGAMENWGLVTYRETALLYDNTSSTTTTKQTIAMTIAHELAHQWFGNLVTLDWWRYTWLNEGFARYFQYYVMDKIETSWRMMDQLLMVQQLVFETDSLASAASLNSDCNTPGEISAKFGAISYNKGASVIRMMQHVLTEESFRKGLHSYLNSSRLDTAVPGHLYSALQTQAAVDGRLVGVDSTVEGLFGKWASTAGYPVIRVERHYENGSATVSQRQFFLTNSAVSSERWCVPLSWTSQTNAPAGFAVTTPSAWIMDNQSSILLQNFTSSQDWVIFNNQESGYYRVNYDEENWRRISAQLDSGDYERIHVLNRAQLLDDAFNLARAGHLDYQVALNVTRYLGRERDLLAWSAAIRGLSFLNTVLAGSGAHEYFKGYVLGALGPLYEEVGFRDDTGDPHTTVLSRGNALTWACRLGLEDCVQRANQTFSAWLTSASPDTSNTIPPNLKMVVYCTAVAYGGESEWNFLWTRYINAELAGEKVLILAALGCSRTTSTLNTYLLKSVSENSGIRKQDAASVFAAVYSNTAGVNTALDFLIQNFRNISSFYGGMSAVSNSLTGIASKLTTEQQVNKSNVLERRPEEKRRDLSGLSKVSLNCEQSLDLYIQGTGTFSKLENFVTQNEAALDSAASGGKIAVESAKANLKWKTSNYEEILAWLSGNNVPAPSGTASFSLAFKYYSIFCVALTYLLM